MTKKDYVLIAEAIKKIKELNYTPENKQQTIQWIVTSIGKALEKDNPRFDGEKFWKACGL